VQRGGRKKRTETESGSGLLEALATLVQSPIRGDPEAALLGVVLLIAFGERPRSGRLASKGPSGWPDVLAAARAVGFRDSG
jgi:hypothetical protein